FAASQGDYRGWFLVPGLLGVLLFSRLVKRVDWMSRWSLAVIIGVYAGFKTTGFSHGGLLPQAQGRLPPLWGRGTRDAGDAGLLTVGLVTSLLFFFYSREHKGTLGVAARTGIVFLMVSFGAGYGYTVMSRLSLLIGRFQFLVNDWLGMK